MTQPKPIPKLDLAPKLNRPLSLWNPLDYLRLLYWCFYFPQALRWYEEQYGEKGSSFYLKLRIQEWLLFILFFFLLYMLSEPRKQTNFFVMVTNVVQEMPEIMFLCFVLNIIFVFALVFNSVLSIVDRAKRNEVGGIVQDIGGEVGSIVEMTVTFGVMLGVISGVISGVRLGVISGVVLGGLSSLTFLVSCVAWFVTCFRPENWLMYSLLNYWQSLQNGSWLFPRITPLPLPLLEYRLKIWLRQDWLLGLNNANELLKYSFQFIPVVTAVNQVLVKIPADHLIFRVSQLAENPHDWKLVKFASASLNEELKSQAIERIFFLPESLKQRLQQCFYTGLRFDTPAHAAAAGFWYLREKEPQKATKAFAVVRDLLYGEEMYVLAHTLTQFQNVKKPDAIAKIQPPPFPSEPLLRPTTWDALNGFRRVVEDTKLVINGTSKTARSFALNRAIGELRTIRDNADTIPKAEQGLIVDIARTWTTALEGIAQDIGNIAITEPIQNPYVIGDPVEGSLFVGREDIIRQLEELWVMSQQLQSVILYGHRRMGKTSILRNIANCLGSDVTVVYINLQRLGTVSEGMGEVLMAMSDGIADALQIPPPEDEALLQLPQRTFERYLTKVVREMPQKGLIIALDEFEMIEELIEAGQIPANFIGVLRSWVQLHSNVAFVFAGLHTLEEMTADYFQPFFASIIPISVGFLEPAATRQVLTNPNDDFLLNYTGEALDLIYRLTSGQPYLVQLIGFLLVRRYNDQVFELGRSRDSTFTVEDVEAIINHPEFFSQGRYYFTGVWEQATQGSSGQQEILKVLATHSQGLTVDILCQTTGLDETIINEALDTLKRHDVVKQTQQGWQIVVELFRRWVSETIT